MFCVFKSKKSEKESTHNCMPHPLLIFISTSNSEKGTVNNCRHVPFLIISHVKFDFHVFLSLKSEKGNCLKMQALPFSVYKPLKVQFLCLSEPEIRKRELPTIVGISLFQTSASQSRVFMSLRAYNPKKIIAYNDGHFFF